MPPISIQLWTIREQCSEDLPGSLQQLSDIGFRYIEPFSTHEMDMRAFKRLVDDSGLNISSSHVVWGSTDVIDKALEQADTFGIQTCACGFGQKAFADEDSILATAETVNAAVAVLAKHGITMHMHNHWWELERLADGRLKYAVMVQACPDLRYTLDTYWAAHFGTENPVEMIETYGDKALFLHIKDGPLVKDENLLPLGAGRIGVEEVVAAAPDNVRFLIYEQDSHSGDVWANVKASYDKLASLA